jgi:membrane fusion protein, adhesin transport system
MHYDIAEHDTDLADSGHAKWTIRIAMLSLIGLVYWASVSKINQVTRAQAQVIASARTQSMQSPDGGVITRIHVKEGAQVKKGDILVTLQKERAKAAVDDSNGKVAALTITVARLQAEVYGTAFVVPSEVKSYTEFVSNQKNLYLKRKMAIDQDIAALNSMLELANQELDMNLKLQATGDVSFSDVLRLKRQVAEINAQITNKKNKYFQDAQAEMTKAQEDLNTQTEMLRDRSQILSQTDLVASVDGIVKEIKINTLGGVVKPGDTVLDILPTSGDLIVEAKVTTTDIANVSIGQTTSVKLDAYDYAIFGTMPGEVIYISPDTLEEETKKGALTYYRVQIRIDKNKLDPERSKNIKILPGMTASVDIKATDRTVLTYLTKPVFKTISSSLGER